MVATVLKTAVDARLSLAGSQWCFAKFMNQSTVETIRNDEIVCGHVDPEIEGDAAGRELNRFIILMDIDVPLLEALLPKMGMTLDTGVYEADTSLSSMAVLADLGATTHSYPETWITRAIFRGGVSTMPVSLELHCVATQESDEASPTFTPADMDYIYGFPGTTFTVAGTSYEPANFAFVIDRNLVFDWNASRYITGVGRGKRNTLLAVSTPYVAAKKSVYWNNKTLLTGNDVKLTLTNGYDTIQFRMQKAKLNPKAPSIEDTTTPIRLPLTWEARRQVDPASDAFTITIAAVP